VADQLTGSSGTRQRIAQTVDGQVAGVDDSERPLDGAQAAGGLQAPARPPAEVIERGELDRPRGPAAGRRLAGDADETDAVLLRQTQDDREDPWQHMQVLVRVGVDHRQPGGEQPLDLQPQLGFDLGQGETAEDEPLRQGRIAGEQRPVTADQRGDALRRRQRPFADQGQVDSDVQRKAAELLDGGLERAADRGDAHRGDDPGVRGGESAAGHAGMEADVVGGDDELLQGTTAGAPAAA